jgi:hypothetical protein
VQTQKRAVAEGHERFCRFAMEFQALLYEADIVASASILNSFGWRPLLAFYVAVRARMPDCFAATSLPEHL